jgi:hypothetical protein
MLAQRVELLNVRYWPLADIPFDVAFGGKADMTFCAAYVRF